MLRRPAVARRGPGLLGTVARTAVIAGTATATSNAITGRQQRKHEEAAAPGGASASAAETGGVVAELQKLAALKEAGVLTDAEFTAAKAKLLG